MKEFQSHYTNLTGFENQSGLKITKLDILHYVYAVLHNPVYREKYELNLKRDFPRIPFYDDFFQWVEYGKQLMDLHLNYEMIEKYPLIREEINPPQSPFIKGGDNKENNNSPFEKGARGILKPKLKADKENGIIIVDDKTMLKGIPTQAWEYKLGNRSALEWILDQYKEKTPKDKTIAEQFNTYRFADYKEAVIALLMRVCTVSVETVKIIQQLQYLNK